MTERSENLFWQFSLNCYSKEGVQETLLALQDQHGCHINVLLWGLWLGEERQQVSREALDSALNIVDHHQNTYLRPLRQLRKQLKFHPDKKQYDDIKSLELSLERWEQDQLFSLSVQTASAEQAARYNIELYLNILQDSGTTQASDRAKLEALLEQLLKQAA